VPGQIYRETGVSSWYGKDFHGRKTANGETYDMYGISAAHRTLPLGTYIRVTNLDNYKSVKVKVNDRGPFAKNRVLDLSYGAAKELGFVAQGTTKVRIETFEEVRDLAPSYTVQVGAFIEEENARMLKQRLSRKYDTIYIIPFESNTGKFFRVRVGSYSTEEKAERVANGIMLEGVEPIVVRKD
jgi:rare lipoprotein A